MISYRGVSLTARTGTISIASGNMTEIRKFPGRDLSSFVDLGKNPTYIAMTLRADNETEKRTIMQLLHYPVKGELIIDQELYKQVIPDPEFNFKPLANLGDGKWSIPCRFVALDPVAYDIETGEVIY